MQPTEQLAVILPMLTKIVGRIEPTQLDDPTPCAAFTVRGIVEHMIAGAESFAPAFRGIAGGTDREAPSADAHPAGRFRSAMADLLDAVQGPGALDRTVDAPFGQVSGEVFARFVAFDGLIHGWDLATSTGQPYDPAEELVTEVDAFARQALAPGMRDGDTFCEEAVPSSDASTLLRLVAFSGRSAALNP